MSYKALVFIGRFQPFHNGHYGVISKALEIAEKVVIVIGSAASAPNLLNPFSEQTRRNMIEASFPEMVKSGRLRLVSVMDKGNDNLWVPEVQKTVCNALPEYPDAIMGAGIGLIGHYRDSTSYYLGLFPRWEPCIIPSIGDTEGTKIRNALFFNPREWGKNQDLINNIPDGTKHVLIDWMQTESAFNLAEEYKAVQEYKALWANSPFPPTFVTVDAVVIQAGHVLMVQRKSYPGKGLWALPGGFISHNEKIKDSMLRKLRDETRIKVPLPVLEGSIKRSQVFDDPRRSARGRVISHAYLIELRADPEGFPKVRGGEEAEKARWVPLAAIDPSELFEDHYFIIKSMLN